MINNTGNKYTKQSIFFSVVLGFCFLLVDKRDLCRGVVLGGIFSVINFILLKQHLYSRMGKTRNKALLSAIVSIIGRFLLMALPLFLSLKLDRFSILGVILGLFTVQLTILYDYLHSFFSYLNVE